MRYQMLIDPSGSKGKGDVCRPKIRSPRLPRHPPTAPACAMCPAMHVVVDLMVVVRGGRPWWSSVTQWYNVYLTMRDTCDLFERRRDPLRTPRVNFCRRASCNNVWGFYIITFNKLHVNTYVLRIVARESEPWSNLGKAATYAMDSI